jgi:hypothetical protein
MAKPVRHFIKNGRHDFRIRLPASFIIPSETFEKRSILPTQLNPHVIFNRGSSPRIILKDSRTGQLSSCPQGGRAWGVAKVSQWDILDYAKISKIS